MRAPQLDFVSSSPTSAVFFSDLWIAYERNILWKIYLIYFKYKTGDMVYVYVTQLDDMRNVLRITLMIS